jgi:hypothetical protein
MIALEMEAFCRVHQTTQGALEIALAHLAAHHLDSEPMTYWSRTRRSTLTASAQLHLIVQLSHIFHRRRLSPNIHRAEAVPWGESCKASPV